MIRVAFAVAAALLTAAPALAQAPHPELPSAGQPVRNVPTTGYTLSLIWAPEHCFKGGGEECTGGAARRGFTLHGLWPDGDGPNRWPQYCHPVAVLTDPQIAAGIGATPSRQLLQHEWAKHGSCMYSDPIRYFADEDRVFATIKAPDMATLAHRRGLKAGDFQTAFAAANPGMTADMMRLNVNKNGWLEEVWICLGLDKAPRACPASQGGATPGDVVKVQAVR
jgi:ribonuclease T2